MEMAVAGQTLLLEETLPIHPHHFVWLVCLQVASDSAFETGLCPLYFLRYPSNAP